MIGLLTEQYALRRYSEELDRRRRSCRASRLKHSERAAVPFALPRDEVRHLPGESARCARAAERSPALITAALLRPACDCPACLPET